MFLDNLKVLIRFLMALTYQVHESVLGIVDHSHFCSYDENAVEDAKDAENPIHNDIRFDIRLGL